MSRRFWSAQECAMLIELWPDHSAAEVTEKLAELTPDSPLSIGRVRRMANYLNLKHSPEVRSRLCRAALVIGREAKKACVTKAALPKAVEPVTNRLTVERPARGVTVYTHRLGG